MRKSQIVAAAKNGSKLRLAKKTETIVFHLMHKIRAQVNADNPYNSMAHSKDFRPNNAEPRNLQRI